MKSFFLAFIGILFISGELFAGGAGGGISDPLVAAVNAGKIDVVQKELKAEKDIPARLSKKDNHGRTVLMWAAYLNYSNEEKKKEEETKRLGIIKLLIEKGASLTDRDNDGWTPLMWASWSKMDDVVIYFLEKGADVSVSGKNGWTSLMFAAAKADVKVAKALLAKGADKSSKNKKGETALAIAKKGASEASGKEKVAFEQLVELLK